MMNLPAKWIFPVIPCGLVSVSFWGCSSSDHHSQTATTSIGALLDIDGEDGEEPSDVKAARLAVTDLNAEYAQTGEAFEIEIHVADTQADPHEAMVQAEQLYEQGIRVMIGPESSAAAAYLLPWANENGVLLLSATSTSPYLAIADDHLYRLTPDDRYQAQTLVERMASDGVDVLLPVYRNDIYGQQLHAYLREFFIDKVADQVLEPVVYDPYVAAEADLVVEMTQQLAGWEGFTVGVVVIGLDEAAALLEELATAEAFPDVLWYGSDGMAFSDTLSRNLAAAQFAVDQQMIFSHYYDADIENHTDYLRLVEALGSPLNGADLNVYDAVTLAARLYEEEGSDAEVEALTGALEALSGSLHGLSGTIEWNDAGDRVDNEHYEFCRLHQQADGSYHWSEE